MLRPMDIAVLLRLTQKGAAVRTFHQLAADLLLSSSEVHASISRGAHSGLIRFDGRQKLVNRTGLLEFLEHGLRYAFPAEKGELTRGLPTAYAAEPLRSALQADNGPPPVWPHREGKERGYSFAPLYKRAPEAALRCPAFYELLSLADALRDGRIRERALALEEIRKRAAVHG